MAYLSWQLNSSVNYQAYKELDFNIRFTVPEDGKYYLLGALYTPAFEYIPETLFGVMVPDGSDYALNSSELISVWELSSEDQQELNCKFIFDRSDVILGIFLMKMTGDKPDFTVDEQVDSISAQLSSQAWLERIEPVIGLVMIMSIFVLALYSALSE